MPASQLILLAIVGIAVMVWGARLDLKNHRKEKAERQARDQREA
ncbi:hypothetical protein [Pseudomonas sp. M47T1]|nr:hypothetical protein [Pseudomonas sp. M47T1]